jgi:hypothetical protein
MEQETKGSEGDVNDEYTKRKAIDLATTCVIESVANPFLSMSKKELEENKKDLEVAYKSLNNMGAFFSNRNRKDVEEVKGITQTWFEFYLDLVDENGTQQIPNLNNSLEK